MEPPDETSRAGGERLVSGCGFEPIRQRLVSARRVRPEGRIGAVPAAVEGTCGHGTGRCAPRGCLRCRHAAQHIHRMSTAVLRHGFRKRPSSAAPARSSLKRERPATNTPSRSGCGSRFDSRRGTTSARALPRDCGAAEVRRPVRWAPKAAAGSPVTAATPVWSRRRHTLRAGFGAEALAPIAPSVALQAASGTTSGSRPQRHRWHMARIDPSLPLAAS